MIAPVPSGPLPANSATPADARRRTKAGEAGSVDEAASSGAVHDVTGGDRDTQVWAEGGGEGGSGRADHSADEDGHPDADSAEREEMAESPDHIDLSA